MLPGRHFRRSNAGLELISKAITQNDKTLWIVERQRSQEDPFNEREDSGCRPDSQRQGKDNGEGKTWRFPKRAQCSAKTDHGQGLTQIRNDLWIADSSKQETSAPKWSQPQIMRVNCWVQAIPLDEKAIESAPSA
jgi:hypothetical protein